MIQYAIIGIGPRGGYAFQRLMGELARRADARPARITLFEASDFPGSGPVYSLEGEASNWVNLTERALLLEAREEMTYSGVVVPGFPDYHTWAGFEPEAWPAARPDQFPSRRKVGQYMHERFQTLAEPLRAAGIARLVQSCVERVFYRDGACKVRTNDGETQVFDEVLLTVGHQPTEPDEQLAEWKETVARVSGLTLYSDPYPVSQYTGETGLAGDRRVAVRGYGLAMIDAVRALAEQHGTFTLVDGYTRRQTYALKGPTLVVAPFSLDGMTMGAKPLNAKIDRQYRPEDEELEQLESLLSDQTAQSTAKGVRFLTRTMAPVIARRFKELERPVRCGDLTLESVSELVERWLLDSTIQHGCIMDRNMPPEDALDIFIGMATGVRDVTLDYCAGQVWRQCHTLFRRAFSHGALPADVFSAIIELDERMKRFSFGPPVESHQQLLALCEAGVLTLDTLEDPAIECSIDGWTLRKGEAQFTATTMIDSVLDDPKVKRVSSPLIKGMLEDGLMAAVDNHLGVETDENGYIIRKEDGQPLPIALLGRLAKGTVIGVDAITECFGDRPAAWARAAARRARLGAQKSP
ncbi:FAD/NAD(P)-binding protein [Saltatorellus ferox]|uniref:FAD/NAD(P)-binding protein n=1 Tax=Saltatorellus ferox TaxID=2528018 RepID=UPI003AF3B1E8